MNDMKQIIGRNVRVPLLRDTKTKRNFTKSLGTLRS